LLQFVSCARNKQYDFGGAVAVYGRSGGLMNMLFESNTFMSNFAGTIDGGAVFVFESADVIADVIIKNNTFTGNAANFVSECQIDCKPQLNLMRISRTLLMHCCSFFYITVWWSCFCYK
jgi:hypothetical protein